MNLNLIVLALYISGCAIVAWGTYRFFTRPDGKMAPAMKWLTRFSYIGGGVQIYDLLHTEPPSRAHAFVAMGLMVAANALYLWAVAIHGRKPPSLAYSKDAPDRLVTRGPYSLVRHPFYTSYMMAWACPAIATGRVTSIAAVVIIAIFFEAAARQEEQKFLTSELDGEYRRYVAHTGRFLPNPWKMWRGAFDRSVNA
jgi:protein-S-isoprenylcysteine O-methyltransferase Ste14